MSDSPAAVEYQFHEGYEPHTTRLLLPHIMDFIQRAGAKRVMDIGCGNGSIAREVSRRGISVVGVEPSESGLAQCRENCPDGRFYQLGVYDNPDDVEEKAFDFAYSTEVIEHLFNPRALPRFAAAKLAPGGQLLLTTPYHGWLKNVAISVLNKWDKHHTVLWDGGHVKFWSRQTLTQLLEEEGFAVTDFRGCGRAPYLWESMILLARKR
ncbi:class I SAM-dependent methyltransferase [Cerasicoccus fimbriatus]|uniref:class I SAM-dependent methyltransferase n=1 Tax=Cerasicoccus fimbriatus TaxID=3014554 RepID=UPI0022B3041F|nr:class I SAM-dependent methyltransferase [Cerasicoccus sp. TK19100]